MRIAQVAPLFESVPPHLYGGTERVVWHLTEELIRQGHDVTLYASGDSSTSADLVSCRERALRLDPSCRDPLPWQVLQLERVIRDARRFDVIHFHVDTIHLPFARRIGRPHLTTLHGRLDVPDLAPLYREYPDVPLVSISHAQRRPLRFATWVSTVYHGLDASACRFHPDRGDYLAFVGRVSPEKRVEDAVAIAIEAGMPLRIAAKVGRDDAAYYEAKVKPLLSHPLVEFVGEIGEEEKDAFLGGAAALLFPIDWPEPFGLVMIEAMARGTPVVARRRGSVPEVVDEGVTGVMFDALGEAAGALRRALALDRRKVRERFEERFSVARMTRDYVSAYRAVSESRVVFAAV